MKNIHNSRFLLVIAVLVSMLVASCEKDVDVIGPKENTLVVYCILNAMDTIHYVRVNRSFLGQEDAFVIAENPDSINHRDLTVELWQVDDDHIRREDL